MKQRSLFPDTNPKARARARRRDVDTSHEAAGRAEETGSADNQRNRVLAYLRKNAGESFTSHEIANALGMQRQQPARRLPELLELRLVVRLDEKRKCRVAGTNAILWRAAKS